MELKGIVKRDLEKKMIETCAFRQFEAWCDKNQTNTKQPTVTAVVATVTAPATSNVKEVMDTKKEQVKEEVKVNEETQRNSGGKIDSAMKRFDPVNWAKRNLEMDGLRMRMGFKFAKMPSFRRQRPPPVATLADDKTEGDEKSHDKGEFATCACCVCVFIASCSCIFTSIYSIVITLKRACM